PGGRLRPPGHLAPLARLPSRGHPTAVSAPHSRWVEDGRPMAAPTVTEPMRILMVSSRLTDSRRRALTALATGAVDLARTHVVATASDLPSPERYGAVVVDGGTDGLTSHWLTALYRHVEAGASLLLIGGATGSAHRAERFAKVVSPTSVLTQRVPEEFPVVDRLQPLTLAPSAQVCLSVSVGLTDQPAL